MKKKNMNKEKWKIAKQIDMCYGHSVWSQSLNPEYSLDDKLCCRHLHGHQGTIIVHIEGDELTNGMVTDFKHLNWFKKFIDDTLDHKMIIDTNDPGIDFILPGSWNRTKELLLWHEEGYAVIDPKSYSDMPERYQEISEGFVFVDFVPTSENLSKWLHSIVQKKMSKIGVNCTQIQFFETPKSQSNYYGS